MRTRNSMLVLCATVAAITVPAYALAQRITTEQAAEIAREKTGFVYKLDPNARKPHPPGYKAPRLSWGAPDLGGAWSNITLTGLERAASYGDRNALTDEEVIRLEGNDQAIKALSEKNTDPNATTQEVSAQADCSGNRGTGCNYNQGFVDFGNQVMRVNGEPRASFITFPKNGRIPPRKDGGANVTGFADTEEGSAQAAAAAARAGAGAGPRPAQNDNPEGRGRAERCLQSFGSHAGPIMMGSLYNNTYHFQQSRDAVAIWVEMVHDVRIARISPTKAQAQASHRTDGVRPFMGDSVGWYEGDTLVIETTNYPSYTNLRGASANLTMTERFTRVSPTRLLYQFKAEDPTVWNEPWGGEYEFNAAEPIYEYACHEGNYGLQNILAGARLEEQQRAQGGANRTTAAQ